MLFMGFISAVAMRLGLLRPTRASEIRRMLIGRELFAETK